jgi:hypothetical protein
MQLSFGTKAEGKLSAAMFAECQEGTEQWRDIALMRRMPLILTMASDARFGSSAGLFSTDIFVN